MSTSFEEAAGLFVSKLKETQGTAVLLLAIPDQRKTQWHKNI
jgi:hypothetical protein